MSVLITNPENRAKLLELIENYKTLKHQSDEIAKKAKEVRDDIEAFMINKDYEDIVVGAYKVTNKLVPIITIDRKILERDFYDVYQKVAFVKRSTRLTIS